jgi:hypothetical protein
MVKAPLPPASGRTGLTKPTNFDCGLFRFELLAIDPGLQAMVDLMVMEFADLTTGIANGKRHGAVVR